MNKLTTNQIIDALICISTVHGDNYEPNCRNCPYVAWDKFSEKYGCDCDQIVKDAAERLAFLLKFEQSSDECGHWESTADGYADGELVYDMWACSECGYDTDGADEMPDWKYCPNCGAKMEGVTYT